MSRLVTSRVILDARGLKALGQRVRAGRYGTRTFHLCWRLRYRGWQLVCDGRRRFQRAVKNAE